LKPDFSATSILDTLQNVTLARALMVATKLGVFEVLAQKALTVNQIATEINGNPRGTEKLANVLVAVGLLVHDGSLYQITELARRWLLENSDRSLRDYMLFRFLEWEFIESCEEFVLTGEPVSWDAMSEEQWRVYQRGMRSLAGVSADEVALRVPVPEGATRMLDVGGSHGYYSVSICRRHPGLCATVLDLPEAVEHAAPILARERMEDRVAHRVGNALTEDLGENVWNLVFVSQFTHHLDEASNRDLVHRIARALRPGGVLAILEILPPASPSEASATEALLDLYCAVISTSGTWSAREIADWQQAAGLVPKKLIKLRTIPAGGIQAAGKPL